MKRKPRKNVEAQNGFDEWGGYMDAKKSKLEEQFAADALRNPYKESNLFVGISIFVNGLTTPSAEELKRIMMTHGGVFHTYQRSSTTFIIASNLPDVKIRQITTAKIISPQWVVDCLSANKILDYSNYLLYTNCKATQPKLAFKKKVIDAQPDTLLKVDQSLHIENNENVIDPNEKNEPKLDIGLNLDVLNTVIRRESQSDVNDEKSESNPVTKLQRKIESKPEAEIDIKKVSARTAVDPNFLSEFFNNSRLHHIATLGASFKHHISKLRESHDGKFPERDRLKQKIQVNRSSELNDCNGKKVMHIDMDCFFVSVGLCSRPHLKGFPIAVTHSKGVSGNNVKNINNTDRKKEMELYIKRHEDKYKHNESEHSEIESDESHDRSKKLSLIDNTTSLSEIASCSYEARKMGVKNGMFVGAALKLCPQLKTIPYDFESYKEVAHILYNTITQYTVDVEAVSCDEMYVNLSDILCTLGCSVSEFVSYLRNEIISKTGCHCSAGIGENRLQARMATKKAKPNGQFHMKTDDVQEYFADILISDLPGVGFSTTQKCNKLSMKTCADLQHVSLIKLQQEFGKKMGETLYQYCRGIDNKPLSYDQVRKSVSAEVNYGIRFTKDEELNKFLHQLCAEVQSRLMEISSKGKTITLKYMVRAQDAPVETAKFMGHGFCDNATKSTTLSTYTDDLAIITKTVFNTKNMLNVPAHELRGIGIQISKLNTSQNVMTKVNLIKNMFENVQAKQKNTLKYAASKREWENEHDKYRSDRNSSIRKVKSFNGTPTTKIHNEYNSKQQLHRIYESLDLNILAELPSNIQDEILRDKDRLLNEESDDMRSIQAITTKRAIARKLENDFNENDAVEMKHEMDTRYPFNRDISGENIFKSSAWRNILSSWFNINGLPLDSDIQLISTYLAEFACARKLYDMMVFLRFLHRKIERMDCRWHQIYYRINEIVQSEVKLSFGPTVTLNAESSFDCENCKK